MSGRTRVATTGPNVWGTTRGPRNTSSGGGHSPNRGAPGVQRGQREGRQAYDPGSDESFTSEDGTSGSASPTSLPVAYGADLYAYPSFEASTTAVHVSVTHHGKRHHKPQMPVTVVRETSAEDGGSDVHTAGEGGQTAHQPTAAVEPQNMCPLPVFVRPEVQQAQARSREERLKHANRQQRDIMREFRRRRHPAGTLEREVADRADRVQRIVETRRSALRQRPQQHARRGGPQQSIDGEVAIWAPVVTHKRKKGKGGIGSKMGPKRKRKASGTVRVVKVDVPAVSGRFVLDKRNATSTVSGAEETMQRFSGAISTVQHMQEDVGDDVGMQEEDEPGVVQHEPIPVFETSQLMSLAQVPDESPSAGHADPAVGQDGAVHMDAGADIIAQDTSCSASSPREDDEEAAAEASVGKPARLDEGVMAAWKPTAVVTSTTNGDVVEEPILAPAPGSGFEAAHEAGGAGVDPVVHAEVPDPKTNPWLSGMDAAPPRTQGQMAATSPSAVYVVGDTSRPTDEEVGSIDGIQSQLVPSSADLSCEVEVGGAGAISEESSVPLERYSVIDTDFGVAERPVTHAVTDVQAGLTSQPQGAVTYGGHQADDDAYGHGYEEDGSGESKGSSQGFGVARSDMQKRALHMMQHGLPESVAVLVMGDAFFPKEGAHQTPPATAAAIPAVEVAQGPQDVAACEPAPAPPPDLADAMTQATPVVSEAERAQERAKVAREYAKRTRGGRRQKQDTDVDEDGNNVCSDLQTTTPVRELPTKQDVYDAVTKKVAPVWFESAMTNIERLLVHKSHSNANVEQRLSVLEASERVQAVRQMTSKVRVSDGSTGAGTGAGTGERKTGGQPAAGRAAAGRRGNDTAPGRRGMKRERCAAAAPRQEPVEEKQEPAAEQHMGEREQQEAKRKERASYVKKVCDRCNEMLESVQSRVRELAAIGDTPIFGFADAMALLRNARARDSGTVKRSASDSADQKERVPISMFSVELVAAKVVSMMEKTRAKVAQQKKDGTTSGMRGRAGRIGGRAPLRTGTLRGAAARRKAAQDEEKNAVENGASGHVGHGKRKIKKKGAGAAVAAARMAASTQGRTVKPSEPWWTTRGWKAGCIPSTCFHQTKAAAEMLRKRDATGNIVSVVPTSGAPVCTVQTDSDVNEVGPAGSVIPIVMARVAAGIGELVPNPRAAAHDAREVPVVMTSIGSRPEPINAPVGAADASTGDEVEETLIDSIVGAYARQKARFDRPPVVVPVSSRRQPSGIVLRDVPSQVAVQTGVPQDISVHGVAKPMPTAHESIVDAAAAGGQYPAVFASAAAQHAVEPRDQGTNTTPQRDGGANAAQPVVDTTIIGQLEEKQEKAAEETMMKLSAMQEQIEEQVEMLAKLRDDASGEARAVAAASAVAATAVAQQRDEIKRIATVHEESIRKITEEAQDVHVKSLQDFQEGIGDQVRLAADANEAEQKETVMERMVGVQTNLQSTMVSLIEEVKRDNAARTSVTREQISQLQATFGEELAKERSRVEEALNERDAEAARVERLVREVGSAARAAEMARVAAMPHGADTRLAGVGAVPASAEAVAAKAGAENAAERALFGRGRATNGTAQIVVGDEMGIGAGDHGVDAVIAEVTTAVTMSKDWHQDIARAQQRQLYMGMGPGIALARDGPAPMTAADAYDGVAAPVIRGREAVAIVEQATWDSQHPVLSEEAVLSELADVITRSLFAGREDIELDEDVQDEVVDGGEVVAEAPPLPRVQRPTPGPAETTAVESTIASVGEGEEESQFSGVASAQNESVDPESFAPGIATCERAVAFVRPVADDATDVSAPGQQATEVGEPCVASEVAVSLPPVAPVLTTTVGVAVVSVTPREPSPPPTPSPPPEPEVIEEEKVSTMDIGIQLSPEPVAVTCDEGVQVQSVPTPTSDAQCQADLVVEPPPPPPQAEQVTEETQTSTVYAPVPSVTSSTSSGYTDVSTDAYDIQEGPLDYAQWQESEEESKVEESYVGIAHESRLVGPQEPRVTVIASSSSEDGSETSGVSSTHQISEGEIGEWIFGLQGQMEEAAVVDASARAAATRISHEHASSAGVGELSVVPYSGNERKAGAPSGDLSDGEIPMESYLARAVREAAQRGLPGWIMSHALQGAGVLVNQTKGFEDVFTANRFGQLVPTGTQQQYMTNEMVVAPPQGEMSSEEEGEIGQELLKAIQSHHWGAFGGAPVMAPNAQTAVIVQRSPNERASKRASSTMPIMRPSPRSVVTVEAVEPVLDDVDQSLDSDSSSLAAHPQHESGPVIDDDVAVSAVSAVEAPAKGPASVSPSTTPSLSADTGSSSTPSDKLAVPASGGQVRRSVDEYEYTVLGDDDEHKNDSDHADTTAVDSESFLKGEDHGTPGAGTPKAAPDVLASVRVRGDVDSEVNGGESKRIGGLRGVRSAEALNLGDLVDGSGSDSSESELGSTAGSGSFGGSRGHRTMGAKFAAGKRKRSRTEHDV